MPPTNVYPSPTAPASKLIAITPSDATDLTASNIRSLRIGGAGNLVIIAADDSASVTIAVTAGELLPIRPKKIMAATTATSIVGLA